MINTTYNADHLDAMWDSTVMPTLTEYLKIPCKSPSFDSNWLKNGYMHQAAQLLIDWCSQQSIRGITIELIELPGRTPLIFVDVAGQVDDTVLLYGHIDKQPEASGWSDGKGPWQPVYEDGFLYGRGAADDGYAFFSAMIAIKQLQQLDVAHARCVVVIESSEESGSFDLPAYLEYLSERIGQPSLIVCLDSGAGNYDQLWATTSLRGVIGGELSVRVLDQAMHSGVASGVVPSPFLVLRLLLSRLESGAGKIVLPELFVSVPPDRLQQIHQCASVLSDVFFHSYSFFEGVRPLESDVTQALLARTWEPALSITGLSEVPTIDDAGNVTLPSLRVKLSVRIPPTLSPDVAQAAIREVFEADVPFGAAVEYVPTDFGSGWNAPSFAPWLASACDDASMAVFGRSAMSIGEGGSIPFMGMLSDMFPNAQFLITGVLGPQSNAHGPDECLNVPYTKKVTACISRVLAAHAAR